MVAVLAVASPPALGDDSPLARAMEAYDSGDVETAMNLADRALAEGGLNDIGEGRAYFYRAEGRLMSGQLQAALDDYAEVEARIDGNIHTASGRALAYYLLGRDREAWDNAEVALVIGPVTTDNQVIRGLAAWQLGRNDAAVADLGVAVDTAPGRGLPKAALGNVLAALGRETEAQRYLAEAGSGMPSGATELTFLAMLASKGRSEARSIELFCWAAAVNPDDNPVLRAVVERGLIEGRC